MSKYYFTFSVIVTDERLWPNVRRDFIRNEAVEYTTVELNAFGVNLALSYNFRAALSEAE
jgi:hypothetical protein